MNVVPLGDKVVVKRVEAEDVTAGGIVLPDSAKEKPQWDVCPLEMAFCFPMERVQHLKSTKVIESYSARLPGRKFR